ncbi:hypothetical protein CYMTET_8413, partial [Cymbomonas tetramitiformis]
MAMERNASALFAQAGEKFVSGETVCIGHSQLQRRQCSAPSQSFHSSRRGAKPVLSAPFNTSEPCTAPRESRRFCSAAQKLDEHTEERLTCEVSEFVRAAARSVPTTKSTPGSSDTFASVKEYSRSLKRDILTEFHAFLRTKNVRARTSEVRAAAHVRHVKFDAIYRKLERFVETCCDDSGRGSLDGQASDIELATLQEYRRGSRGLTDGGQREELWTLRLDVPLEPNANPPATSSSLQDSERIAAWRGHLLLVLPLDRATGAVRNAALMACSRAVEGGGSKRDRQLFLDVVPLDGIQRQLDGAEDGDRFLVARGPYIGSFVSQWREADKLAFVDSALARAVINPNLARVEGEYLEAPCDAPTEQERHVAEDPAEGIDADVPVTDLLNVDQRRVVENIRYNLECICGPP